jgi:outer membrane lipoprotein SlyB
MTAILPAHAINTRPLRPALALTLALAACAAPPSALPPQAPPAPVAGQMTLGRIVAIRQVTIANGQGAGALNAVLNALNQGNATFPVGGQEVVIKQDDGNTIAVTYNGRGFAVGDEVGIIAADQTTLIHR